MSAGRYCRRPERISSGDSFVFARKEATCMAAWVPAPVRPEPATSTGWPRSRERRVSSFPWMVCSVLPCFCHPFQRVPS